MISPGETVRSILDIALPPTCICCGAPLADGGGDRHALCDACAEALGSLASEAACPRCGRTVGPYASCRHCAEELPPFASAVRVGVYDGPLAEMVRRAKYRDARYAVRLLADLLLAKLHQAQAAARADVMTVVPLHWIRFCQRGYNQSWRLGRELGRRGLGVPLARLLVRTRNTAPQVGLSREARRRNVRGAFRVRRAAKVHGRRVLLLDDVMTTGATMGACARALRQAGAAEVVVAVAATAESPTVAHVV